MNLNAKIKSMYDDRLDLFDKNSKGYKEEILKDIFAKMPPELRVELMVLADVFVNGNIPVKRKGCVDYMSKNILKTEVEEDTKHIETDFKNLSDIEANKDINQNKKNFAHKPTKEEISSVLNDTNKELRVTHSRVINDGKPLDVIKGVLKGRGLETLDVLYMDKRLNIVTCVKSGKKESIRLNSDDFENTRIVLDLLSIEYLLKK